jgi:hypothetical protein
MKRRNASKRIWVRKIRRRKRFLAGALPRCQHVKDTVSRRKQVVFLAVTGKDKAEGAVAGNVTGCAETVLEREDCEHEGGAAKNHGGHGVTQGFYYRIEAVPKPCAFSAQSISFGTGSILNIFRKTPYYPVVIFLPASL